MSNMSYCRFENTSRDIADCIEALDEVDWNLKDLMEGATSEDESRGMKRFVKLCREVVDGFEYDEFQEKLE